MQDSGDGKVDGDAPKHVGDEAAGPGDDEEEDIPGASQKEVIGFEDPDDHDEDVRDDTRDRWFPGRLGGQVYPMHTEGKITGLRLRGEQIFTYADYGVLNFKMFGSKYAKLRHLTHLWTWGVGGPYVEEGGSYSDIPYRGATKLTHLKVTTSQMSSRCLARIIGFSDNCLKSFTYHNGGLHSADTSLALIQPEDIWAILDGSSATLEKLDIDFDSQLSSRERTYWELGPDGKDEASAAIKTVKERVSKGGQRPEFPNLKCLRIGIQALMGLMMPPGSGRLRVIDGLPKDLEELTIRGYSSNVASEDYVQQIEELLENLPTKLPKLTKVEGIDECISNGCDVREGDDDYNDSTSEEEVDWSDNSDGY